MLCSTANIGGRLVRCSQSTTCSCSPTLSSRSTVLRWTLRSPFASTDCHSKSLGQGASDPLAQAVRMQWLASGTPGCCRHHCAERCSSAVGKWCVNVLWWWKAGLQSCGCSLRLGLECHVNNIVTAILQAAGWMLLPRAGWRTVRGRVRCRRLSGMRMARR